FFRLARAERTQPTWEPPVDVFEDEEGVVIVVALPGVPADRVELAYESGVLVVRAQRPLPFPGTRRAIRQLEIPYGYFDSRIPLNDTRLEAGAPELRDGCLILRLQKSR